MACKAIRQGDQMQCGKCGLSWDVDDTERPKCTDVNATPLSVSMQRERSLKKLDWVRRTNGLRGKR